MACMLWHTSGHASAHCACRPAAAVCAAMAWLAAHVFEVPHGLDTWLLRISAAPAAAHLISTAHVPHVPRPLQLMSCALPL
jgi:hypothetical protein